MPNYGLHKYGTFQYGRYQLVGSGGKGSIGPHVQYRMRIRPSQGVPTTFIDMHHIRMSIPGDGHRIRLRADGGDWVYAEKARIDANASKIRIRAVGSNGEPSPWVFGERGNLTNP